MTARKHGTHLALAAALAAVCVAGPARAFEAWDGRLQAHGFFESQMRYISADYGEDWDMAQWYQVFNLELEVDLLPDGWGPFDLMSGFVRLEARYDCVYSAGCGMFRSVNAFGDRSKNSSLPRRLSNANERTNIGAIQRPNDADHSTVDGSRRSGGVTNPVTLRNVSGFSILAGSTGADGVLGAPDQPFADPKNGIRDIPLQECLTQDTGRSTGQCARLAGGSQSAFRSTLNQANDRDDPNVYVFEALQDYYFTQVNTRGGGGAGLATKVFGPWLPKNFVRTNASMADRINPFDNSVASPTLQGAVFNTNFLDNTTDTDSDAVLDAAMLNAQAVSRLARGGGANPYRPSPVNAAGQVNQATRIARGLYLPSEPLRRNVSDLDSFDFNFREKERAWNRGASQQDEKELKEAYLDMEFFDSQLFVRLGKQSIVWGKTELFRTTDQFNPQDLALASLPSLEESRISLWSARGIWSFYEVGPLEDVRLEVAVNFDQFEAADLGACGEAYTPNLVCELTFGGFAHGTAGIGVAGVKRPSDPWADADGLEIGGRLEWRWERFSFAIVDFWGYNDTPTINIISNYERNVDPTSLRPRIMGARGDCTNGNEAACLQKGPTYNVDQPWMNAIAGTGGVLPSNQQLADTPNNSLDFHHANQQIFALICSTTVGFSSLDPTACAQTVFGSTAAADPSTNLFSVSQIIGAVTAGSPVGNGLLGTVSNFGVLLPIQELSVDGGDLRNPNTNGETTPCLGSYLLAGGQIPCGGTAVGDPRNAGNLFAQQGQALGQHLTPEQEALFGCGPFWGTNCDDDGLDLLNMEASAIIQAFPGIEGTSNEQAQFFSDGALDSWDTSDDRLPQPGTEDYFSARDQTGQLIGSPICTYGDLLDDPSAGSTARLPGCRGPTNAGYDPNVDGNPRGVKVLSPFIATQLTQAGVSFDSTPGAHPFTGQLWQNEVAAASWNFLMLLVAQSSEFSDRLQALDDAGAPTSALVQEAYSRAPFTCSYFQPQYCGTPEAILGVIGVQRNIVEAGGNGRYGRRTFVWHSGGEAILDYQKRNVLGFSMDFAEDATKSNWSMEFTWFEDLNFGTSDDPDGMAQSDTFNLTISADRPTFINFLNPNRTFFFNSQWFFQYVPDYKKGFSSNGPYNFLATFAVSTGYYQDRLLPSLVLVYDVQSVSGAALPQVTYRYNEAFSVSVGAAIFMGREQLRDMPVRGLSPAGNQQGSNAYKGSTENGLSVVRDRDEVFLRLRYTF